MDWIDVEDKLPEIGVLVKVKIRHVSMGGATYSETTGFVKNDSGRFNVEFDWSQVAFWKHLEK